MTTLYWNHIVPDRQRSAAHKIPNHWISSSLTSNRHNFMVEKMGNSPTKTMILRWYFIRQIYFPTFLEDFAQWIKIPPPLRIAYHSKSAVSRFSEFPEILTLHEYRSVYQCDNLHMHNFLKNGMPVVVRFITFIIPLETIKNEIEPRLKMNHGSNMTWSVTV